MKQELPHITLPARAFSRKTKPAKPALFSGFKPPTSNTTFTPNQFFDIVIPHFSRGVVRIVAYLIRKTLGWCDRDGNPQEEQIEVSYSELERKAGVSRDMIRRALDDAMAGRLIECVRKGRPKLAHDAGQTALYALRWSAAYTKKPDDFEGFFEGEGNRTDIPNEFFDVVIPREPLSIIKVVGSVIRHSIGFQTKHGRRRQQVALSYQYIKHYARFGGRSDLAAAIRAAQERHYIIRLEDGIFSPYGDERRSATYAVRWSDYLIGQKSGPAPEQSEIRTSIGQKTGPADESENQTSIKTKLENETLNKQPAADPVLFEKLVELGFTRRTAASLIAKQGIECVRQQLEWLNHRAPAKSVAGMLRRAIEQNWPAPKKLRAPEVFPTSDGRDFARYFYAAFAGNAGEPANEPSERDCDAAGAFVQRLVAAELTPSNIPDYGRAFGQLARDRHQPFASLQLALRQLGDTFLVTVQRQTTSARNASAEATRSTHEAQARPAYERWLAEEELRLKRERPDEHARFLAKREHERANLRGDRAPWALTFLEKFDTTANRLRALQTFFGLPSFWHWDAEISDNPFTPNPPRS